jgi:hypothetical protein
MIVSGNWIQKMVWNRLVTKMERDQTHRVPIASTWTVDFLTREGEGHTTVGDWLRDKTISWKERRRFLQTNSGVFHARFVWRSGANIQQGLTTSVFIRNKMI